MSDINYVKIMTLGRWGCGKTWFVYTFYNKKCPTGSRWETPSPYEAEPLQMIYKDKPIFVGLWDQTRVTDEENCAWIRVLSYPQTDVFFLCFALDDRESITAITAKWHPEVTTSAAGVPIILVGLRSDVREDVSAVQQANALGNPLFSRTDGEDFAKKIGAVRYMECSALGDPASVDNVVNAALEIALASSAKKSTNNKAKCDIM